ncbi:MAG: hypothetical protein KAX18_00335 [Candidatus Lokiarchaeota archaeon]|nr:hypothetical protein [Candidatus Lokiarchaeota archaeon]
METTSVVIQYVADNFNSSEFSTDSPFDILLLAKGKKNSEELLNINKNSSIEPVILSLQPIFVIIFITEDKLY